jgi:hypothetical protein
MKHDFLAPALDVCQRGSRKTDPISDFRLSKAQLLAPCRETRTYYPIQIQISHAGRESQFDSRVNDANKKVLNTNITNI